VDEAYKLRGVTTIYYLGAPSMMVDEAYKLRGVTTHLLGYLHKTRWMKHTN